MKKIEFFVMAGQGGVHALEGFRFLGPYNSIKIQSLMDFLQESWYKRGKFNFKKPYKCLGSAKRVKIRFFLHKHRLKRGKIDLLDVRTKIKQKSRKSDPLNYHFYRNDLDCYSFIAAKMRNS